MTFVAGEPALFLTSREARWKKAIRAAALSPMAHPALHFTVASFRRMGRPFDIDNLAKPVLECIGGRPTTVWVTTAEGTEPGVRVTDEPPPRPAIGALTIVVGNPRSRSARPVAAMEEFVGLSRVGEPHQAIALEIAFASDNVAIWDFSFTGPIKPFIDGMGTVLGPAPQGPADHRIRDLRVIRGSSPVGTGATVSIWVPSAQ